MASRRRVGGGAGLSRGAGGVRLRRVPLEPRSRARSAGPSRQAFARKRRSASLRSSDDPEISRRSRRPGCRRRPSGLRSRRIRSRAISRLPRPRSRARTRSRSRRKAGSTFSTAGTTCIRPRSPAQRRAKARARASSSICLLVRSRFNSAASRAIKFPLSSRPTSRPKGARSAFDLPPRPLTLQFSGVPRDQISVIVSPDQ